MRGRRDLPQRQHRDGKRVVASAISRPRPRPDATQRCTCCKPLREAGRHLEDQPIEQRPQQRQCHSQRQGQADVGVRAPHLFRPLHCGIARQPGYLRSRQHTFERWIPISQEDPQMCCEREKYYPLLAQKANLGGQPREKRLAIAMR